MKGYNTDNGYMGYVDGEYIFRQRSGLSGVDGIKGAPCGASFIHLACTRIPISQPIQVRFQARGEQG